jgi:hypothetical protein
MYLAQLENERFMTAYTVYTGKGVKINAENELRLNRDNLITSLNARLTSSSDIKYVLPSSKKIPGNEFTAETEVWKLYGRFYVSGNHAWGIIYLARKGSESTAVREQFYRSLEIRR